MVHDRLRWVPLLPLPGGSRARRWLMEPESYLAVGHDCDVLLNDNDKSGSVSNCPGINEIRPLYHASPSQSSRRRVGPIPSVPNIKV